ncbi:MAG: hypothetical protein GY913_20375 [Proteobacteria bacterium]|nr:hypothetical protein [Pseudomonadota bacterium]MCP4919264.1 hypothetical protein [Pseudomonadota bacterium]
MLVAFGRSRLGFRLLAAIARDPGLERTVLYEQVWEMPHRASHADNAFHVAVNALRRRLGGALEVVRVGAGYGLGGDPGVTFVDEDRSSPARPPRPAAVARWSGSGSLMSLHDLVGRDDEAAALVEGLGRDRVVALVGPGGIGKTRLAIERIAVLETARRTDVSTARDASELREHLAALMEVPADDVGAGFARLGRCTVLLDDLVAPGVEKDVRAWLREAPSSS